MHIIPINDIHVPELSVYADLTEAQIRSKQADSPLFIAEGVKVIGHALDAGCEAVSLLMETRHASGKASSLLERVGDIPVYTASEDVLKRLTGYALTRGVLCAMKRPAERDWRGICSGASRVAVLEDITDSTNMGAILRSAAALGMDGVLLTRSCCDPLVRRCVRVSMGTVFQVPWARFDTENWIEELRKMGIATVAMALSDDSVSIDDPVLREEKRLAVVLGTEGDGLRDETVARCDHVARIPMAHGVDSLNVAAAAVLAFWELRKTAESASL